MHIRSQCKDCRRLEPDILYHKYLLNTFERSVAAGQMNPDDRTKQHEKLQATLEELEKNLSFHLSQV